MNWILIIIAFHFHDGGVAINSVPFETEALCKEALKQIAVERDYGMVALYVSGNCAQVKQ